MTSILKVITIVPSSICACYIYIYIYSMHACIFISLKKFRWVAIQKEMTVIEVQIMIEKILSNI